MAWGARTKPHGTAGSGAGRPQRGWWLPRLPSSAWPVWARGPSLTESPNLAPKMPGPWWPHHTLMGCVESALGLLLAGARPRGAPGGSPGCSEDSVTAACPPPWQPHTSGELTPSPGALAVCTQWPEPSPRVPAAGQGHFGWGRGNSRDRKQPLPSRGAALGGEKCQLSRSLPSSRLPHHLQGNVDSEESSWEAPLQPAQPRGGEWGSGRLWLPCQKPTQQSRG